MNASKNKLAEDSDVATTKTKTWNSTNEELGLIHKNCQFDPVVHARKFGSCWIEVFSTDTSDFVSFRIKLTNTVAIWPQIKTNSEEHERHLLNKTFRAARCFVCVFEHVYWFCTFICRCQQRMCCTKGRWGTTKYDKLEVGRMITQLPG